eukprot:SM000034S12708  [mRNA]  locus=s34:284792:286477:+ [translate_table: standard]
MLAAYRRLALKLHPDVNKEVGVASHLVEPPPPSVALATFDAVAGSGFDLRAATKLLAKQDAQEQFLRVKQAYQTLSDDGSRARFDRGEKRAASAQDFDPFKWATGGGGANAPSPEEAFYGIGDFFADLQKDLERRSAARREKPKSLWEEISELGEEFVEFLEKEIGIGPPQADSSQGHDKDSDSYRATAKDGAKKADAVKDKVRAEPAKSREEEVEDMLAQLKKELGR